MVEPTITDYISHTDTHVHMLNLELAKGKGLDTCYSTTYMNQTRDQQRFYNLGSGS